ncbi:MAG: AI-2E family transporter [Sedimentisphaerales bacterium]|nr:AI-2E family transporter [Sedimentisphaerales bacterium]
MSHNPKPEVKRHSISFYVILASVLFIFIQTFSMLSPIILSFLLILLISLAVNPLISRMRSFTGGRKLPTGLVAIILVLVIVFTGWAFFVPLKTSVSMFSKQLPVYWERIQKPLIKMEQQAVLTEEKLQEEVTKEIALTTTDANKPKPVLRIIEPAPPKSTKEPGSIRSSLSDMLNGVASSFSAVAFNAAQILIVLVTVFFGVTLMLMNPRPIIGAIFSLVPEGSHNQMLTIVQRIGQFVPQWALATLLGMVTIGLLVFLLMWPIFGFMDAMVLGLVAFVLEGVPYIGPILSSVPAVLLAVGKGGMTPLWVVLAYVAIQALENNVLIPLIMARSMKLHPVAVLFSMLLCVAAFGVLGVLVAAPMVAIVNILHDELYRKRFLPTITDADLDCLARKALHEKLSDDK